MCEYAWKCNTNQVAKSKSQNTNLFAHLLVHEGIWENLPKDFIVRLSRTQRKVDGFSKIVHVIPYRKISNALHIARLFLLKWFACMEYPSLSRPTETPNFLVIFGSLCGRYLTPHWTSAVLVIPQVDSKMEVVKHNLRNLVCCICFSNGVCIQ